jgi:hypothetical protein
MMEEEERKKQRYKIYSYMIANNRYKI